MLQAAQIALAKVEKPVQLASKIHSTHTHIYTCMIFPYPLSLALRLLLLLIVRMCAVNMA